MAVIEFTKEDVGKSVVDVQGQTVGRIVDTQGGAAYVDPDPGLVEGVKSRFGWQSRGEGEFELPGRHVEEVTDDAVHLSAVDEESDRSAVSE